MSKVNFLKPDKANLNTFLYLGTFLFFISIFDVFLKNDAFLLTVYLAPTLFDNYT